MLPPPHHTEMSLLQKQCDWLQCCKIKAGLRKQTHL